MKQISNKFALVLTVVVLVAFTSQSYSQLRKSVPTDAYEKYVGNLQDGINSNNVGLKLSAIQFSGLYKITENTPLLVSKYKDEKDPKIKNAIAISLFMIGNNEALKKIGLDENSLLNSFSLSMFAKMYEVKADDKLKIFQTSSK